MVQGRDTCGQQRTIAPSRFSSGRGYVRPKAARRTARRRASLPSPCAQQTNSRDEAQPSSRPAPSKAAAVQLPESSRGVAGRSADAQPAEAPPRTWIQQQTADRWRSLPARYKVVFATSMSFVVCNMDKVNISVAIMPMAKDYGWSPSVSGIIQSAFFYGYMLTQIPGGYVTARLGGRRVLPAGVSLWSVATAGVPLLAGTLPGLCLSRALVGLGEGVAPAASTDMISRVISNSERSRATSFVFSGLHVGSLLGLLVAPPLIEQWGWRSVFYLFGGIGLVWSLWWERLMEGVLDSEPEIAEALDGYAGGQQQQVPWRAFLRNRPVLALGFTHFCNNWFHYSMLAWLPTYFTDTMNLTISQAAQFSLLPPMAALAASAVAGPLADSLISKDWDVAVVRKTAQCVAFLGPVACLAGASLTQDSYLPLALITLALGLGSWSLAGLYCNHADLSPRHAPILLGLTNTGGAIPGIIGVAITGILLDQTGSWPIALFLPSGVLLVAGSAVFVVFGRADQQDLSDNSPLWFEKYFEPATKRLPKRVPGWQSMTKLYESFTKQDDKQS